MTSGARQVSDLPIPFNFKFKVSDLRVPEVKDLMGKMQ